MLHVGRKGEAFMGVLRYGFCCFSSRCIILIYLVEVER